MKQIDQEHMHTIMQPCLQKHLMQTHDYMALSTRLHVQGRNTKRVTNIQYYTLEALLILNL